METIALFGTGVMGSALTQRLRELGCTLRLYNRSRWRAEALAGPGVSVHDTPAQAACGADIGLSVLTNLAANIDLIEGPQGLLTAALPPCFVLADLGTHPPAALAAAAERWRHRGLGYVEAPVTGSVHDALHGRLNFLAGGDGALVQTARPLLERIGRRVYHLGPIGTGNTAKLAMNLLVATMAWGLAESTAILETAQLDVAAFLDALSASGLASPLYQRLGERYLHSDFAPRFSLGNLEKDISAICELTSRLGLQGRQSALLSDILAGLDPGLKSRDYSVLLTCPRAAAS